MTNPATCDPVTRDVAYAICRRIYRGDCICARLKKDPCDTMVLAACEAQRAIDVAADRQEERA
jgi:hypothetical protein